MFDSFYFAEGLLPNNNESPTMEFQTKSLAQDLNVWNVDRFGIAICKDDPERELSNCAHITSYVFSELETKIQEYKVMFLKNKLILAEKIGERGY